MSWHWSLEVGGWLGAQPWQLADAGLVLTSDWPVSFIVNLSLRDSPHLSCGWGPSTQALSLTLDTISIKGLAF